jgi:hypothetical protein
VGTFKDDVRLAVYLARGRTLTLFLEGKKNVQLATCRSQWVWFMATITKSFVFGGCSEWDTSSPCNIAIKRERGKTLPDQWFLPERELFVYSTTTEILILSLETWKSWWFSFDSCLEIARGRNENCRYYNVEVVQTMVNLDRQRDSSSCRPDHGTVAVLWYPSKQRSVTFQPR